MDTEQAIVAYGYCQCGCGGRTQIPTRNHLKRGMVKGEPRRFIHGHNGLRVVHYVEQDCGFTTPCWVWQLTTSRDGHGRLGVEGRLLMAHVVYYERQHGPVPAGMHVHHRCEQPACVNPEHLEALTPAAHKQHHARLTWEIVRDIRARVSAGERQAALAREYAISPAHTCQIVKNIVWREEQS